ncbi:MAG: Hint domain-containing protein [Rhodobacteraceae bacterium]|nr:Hint domain-containing protein [Paracoccaceae bacterium]MCB2138169.1 Hint domain-containing protein [Paracoccaceae bacterium]
MSWLVVASHRGDRKVAQDRTERREAVAGSLLWEFDLAELRLAPQHLFRARAGDAAVTLSLVTGDRVHVTLRAGDRFCQMSTGFGRPGARGSLRVTLRWDARAGDSTLTAENLAAGTLRQQAVDVAPALTGKELRGLVRCWDHRHPSLVWHAGADHLHPVGPGICMAGDTPIPTARGHLPLSGLRQGDRVITRDGGLSKVLWCGSVEVPALGAYAPVRLKAPPFGHGGDLVVQPSHRLALSGPDVDYMFGEDEVLVEAGALLDGETVVPELAGPLFRYHGLLLDDHHIIAPGGCPMESLCIGGLARDRDLAMTTPLADLARSGRLPVQRRTALRDAEQYEAAALAIARRAGRSLFAA